MFVRLLLELIDFVQDSEDKYVTIYKRVGK